MPVQYCTSLWNTIPRDSSIPLCFSIGVPNVPESTLSVSPTNPVRVLVVQDHPLLASAIAKVLESEADLTVVGIARPGHQAPVIAATHPPSVVLIDFRLPDS